MEPIETFDISPLVSEPTSESVLDSLAIELRSILENCSVAYVVGHGISQHLFTESFAAAKKVLTEEIDILRTLSVRGQGKNFRLGYVDDEIETLSGFKTKVNTKVMWDYVFDSDEFRMLSSDSRRVLRKLWNEHVKLTSLFSMLVAKVIGMDLEEFNYYHRNMGNQDINSSSTRIIYYKSSTTSISDEYGGVKVPPHTDYGTFSFVLQDDIGGLQCLLPTNTYADVPPKPGTLIFLVGDILEMMSKGQLKACFHRVVPTRDPVKMGKPRQSLVYFLHPDLDRTFTKDIDGVPKEVTGFEHIDGKNNASLYFDKNE